MQISNKKRTTYLNNRLMPYTYGKEVLIYNWEAQRAEVNKISNGILPGLIQEKCDDSVSETMTSFTPEIFMGNIIKRKYMETFFDRYRNKQRSQHSKLNLIESQTTFQNNFTSANTIQYDLEPKRWLREQLEAACNSKPKHPQNLDLAKDYGSQTYTGARQRIQSTNSMVCMETTYQSFYGKVSSSAGQPLRMRSDANPGNYRPDNGDGNMFSTDNDGAIKSYLAC